MPGGGRIAFPSSIRMRRANMRAIRHLHSSLRRLLLTAGALALLGATSTSAVSQAAYPARPVRLLVGFAPGGATDTIAREIARGLSERWGQQVVVENKVGAGGAIAADNTARAAADGYTLFLTSDSAIVSAPFTNKDLSYDPLTDLSPISLVSGFPLVLVAHPSL